MNLIVYTGKDTSGAKPSEGLDTNGPAVDTELTL